MTHPKTLPLVFLDVDDVLCMSSPYGGFDVIDVVAGRHVNPEAVYRSVFVARARDALKLVHDAFGGELRYVISSTWREVFDRSQLIEVFRREGRSRRFGPSASISTSTATSVSRPKSPT